MKHQSTALGRYTTILIVSMAHIIALCLKDELCLSSKGDRARLGALVRREEGRRHVELGFTVVA